MSDISYTTEEIAKLLKVSKLTVYDLIKKGELPAYRVGKQMRVDAGDLEAYKRSARSGPALRSPSAPQDASGDAPEARAGNQQESGDARSLVITGQDISLDLLAKHLERSAPSYRPLRSHAGSLDSLISMYQGKSDIVSTHLLDADSGQYNLPYINRILTGHSYMVIHLLQRTAGLYVAKGNPKKLTRWKDLQKPGVRLINREKGAGARVLLDEQLRIHGLDRKSIQGYDHEETSHMGVAGKVSAGEADVGVGTEKTAQMMGSIDFVPMIKEHYDLVVLKNSHTEPWIPRLLEVMNSDALKIELGSIQGYDLSLTGQVKCEI
ncbi:substrate-binding domain-containing protein [Paenibacillus tuaregi]|uniref:substrate-binding domain-containing protein n=1 Tax=Paenibacillus tuaregi TaxID=1816681 RepID=UPI00083823E8|nr:helix-turn-helix transcriptional regulator [Paenibacillus tuaregi]